MVPHGFRFNPTDEELIQILDKKASNQEMPLHFIIHANIYDNEPQHLQWSHSEAIGNDERYYYCKRENDSREVSGRGWWKATSHVKKVHVSKDLIGYKRPLTFHKYKDQLKNRNNAIKTNWIMHEYSLQSKETEWRLCKIKYKGKPSIQEDMENIRQRYSSSNNNSEEAGTTSMNTQSGSNNREQDKQDEPSVIALDNAGHHQADYYWNLQEQIPETQYDMSSGSNYYFSEQLDPSYSEQQFPSLWSW
ncbi:hypothetical protein JCGZ_23747 [Jatropha curcas]|uniref:NAC transcription factor 091 n=1 Tax=Jatropha curcas TaxID=180498 RepID=R4N5T7_JATCU|nr:NAC domain-containing protein 83 [Jatropha curcas]AGL39747.1 NAC transcription factor 091 [Jatropha curcas]KDP42805.1 hypothetical protein JCGZ_23747 [Jatropha curcas]